MYRLGGWGGADVYKVLVGRLLVRHRHVWRIILKWVLYKLRWEGVYWFHLAQDIEKESAVVEPCGFRK